MIKITVKDGIVTIRCGLCGKPIRDFSQAKMFWQRNKESNEADIMLAHKECEGHDIRFDETAFAGHQSMQLDVFWNHVTKQLAEDGTSDIHALISKTKKDERKIQL